MFLYSFSTFRVRTEKATQKSEKGSAVSSSMRTSLSKACNQTAPGRAVEIPQSLIQR